VLRDADEHAWTTREIRERVRAAGLTPGRDTVRRICQKGSLAGWLERIESPTDEPPRYRLRPHA
jgi:hypothetical protein